VTEPPQQKLFSPVLETARLILRPARIEDAPAIQRKFPKWEIVKYLGGPVPWPYPEDGAETHLRDHHIPRVRAGEQCGWIICLKSDVDDPIGLIDLRAWDGEKRDMRGFWLDTEHHGHGYMTEAANRVTDFAFRDLGFAFLWVTNALPNTKSAGVKQRQGAKLVETVEGEFVSGKFPKQVWYIDGAEWLKTHPAP
jgi:ribosomal-protein-alanine N-acetyltransferase